MYKQNFIHCFKFILKEKLGRTMNMCGKINIIEWNIHGAAGYGNHSIPFFVSDWIMNNNIHIAILTEFVIGSGWDYLKGSLEKEYNLYISPYVSNSNQCLIAIKKNVGFDLANAKAITEMNTGEEEKPNFLQVEVVYNSSTINIIGTRIRNSRNQKEWQALDEHLTSQKDEVVICMGDFNAYWSNKDGCFWRKSKNKTLPKTSFMYELETPKWDIKNNGFSYVLPNGNCINVDSLIYKGISSVQDIKYNWQFINSKNGYGNMTPRDQKSHLIGLPDHAILYGSIII